MRDDYAVAVRGEDWRNFDVVMDVVGPAVEQDHGGAVRRPGLGITDIEHTGVDLLQRGERCAGHRLVHRQRRFGFGMRRAEIAEFGGSKGERSSAEKAAAVMVDAFVHIDLVHG